MIHETNERAKLLIEDSRVTFNEIYNKPYFPAEFEKDIKKADALLIPYERFGDVETVFPEGTFDFFDFLRREAVKQGVSIDVCISDDEFKTLELHADVVNLPIMILTLGVLPVITGIIASYLFDKMKSRRTELAIKVSIIVESDGKSKQISYEGNADKFEQSMKAIDETVLK